MKIGLSNVWGLLVPTDWTDSLSTVRLYEERVRHTTPRNTMGLFASASKRDVKGAVDALGFAAATAQAQAQGAIGQAQALGADGQAAYTELQDGADEKVQEAMALKAQLQDADVPVAAKALAVFRFLLPVLKGLWHLLCCLLPLYFKLFEYLYFAYTWAPKKLVTMTVGVVLCFFGGTYVASLAAIEAFINMGGERLWADIVYVYEQCKLVVKANDKDEEKGGGIKDALNSAFDEGEMPGPELAQRKVYMALQTIREPGRLENAVGSLWSAYVAVLATLSLQFAQVCCHCLFVRPSSLIPWYLIHMICMALNWRRHRVDLWGAISPLQTACWWESFFFLLSRRCVSLRGTTMLTIGRGINSSCCCRGFEGVVRFVVRGESLAVPEQGKGQEGSEG